jgi:7 transmembrane receptor (rhodopsin family)
MLIVNQSCADLMASILTVCPYLSFGPNMVHDSAWDQFVCRFLLSGFLLYTAFCASTYNILVLTIERYVSIIYPVVHKVCRVVYRL